MSLRKIKRRLSHTFRFTVDGSLSELAEHLTIDETSGDRRYLGMPEDRNRQNGKIVDCINMIEAYLSSQAR